MQVGAVITERFELLERAGAGGMGTVWRAVDRTTGMPIALKVLHLSAEDAQHRFEREGRLLAELSHPGVVRYVARGALPTGEPFLAMDWLEGRDLRHRLAAGGLDLAETMTVGLGVARALAAVHERGIVHRDIKPSNLFLENGDVARVKILDFGVARSLTAVADRTQTGLVVGTPGFMAPEQARGERTIDARADVFSLGCVLFACLTGKNPFAGENLVAVLAKILLEDAPRVSDLVPGVPAALDDLIARMMAKEPGDRPGGGGPVLGELNALEASGILTEAGAVVRAPAGTASAQALTGSERRFFSIVLCLHAMTTPAQGDDTMATLTGGEVTARRQRIQAAHGPFGAQIDWLLDGSLLVTLSGRGTATDQAAQAARCAIALSTQLAGTTIVLCTGHGVLAGRLPVGEVIDRAAAMARRGRGRTAAEPSGAGSRVLVDEVTVGLLDARFEVEQEADPADPDRAPRAVLRGEREARENVRTLLGRPSSCVGRDRELRMLTDLYEECAGEPISRVVLVTGPPGIGKSRVRYELLSRLGRLPRPPEVWSARGDPLSAGSPFGILGRAIRRAAGILDGESADVRRSKLLAKVARHVKGREMRRVAEFVGEIALVPFDDGGSVQLRAARQDARLMADQTMQAAVDLVAAVCRTRPLMLVLEDLHWGDLPTVKLVETLVRALEGEPLFVFAVARPEVYDVFPGLWAERAPQEVRLGQLTRKNAEALVREALPAAADSVVKELVLRSGGNAFYLEELIRAVAEGKTGELPDTVLAMVEARIERLEPEARRVLRAGAVFGEVFWESGVARLLDEAPAEWLRVLADREVITPRHDARFPGEREFVFRHALVREGAYAMLTERDRVLGHKLAAEWLISVGEMDAVLLAEHLERGGDRERAAGWYQRAAEQALGGNDLAAAIHRAGRCVECGAEGEVRAAARLIQAEAHRWRGEMVDARTRAVEAMAHMPAGSPGFWMAAAELGGAAIRLGDEEELVVVVKTLLDLAGSRPIERAQAIALGRLVQQVHYGGRVDLADAALALIDAADPAVVGEPAVAMRVAWAKAQRAHAAGDLASLLRWRSATVSAAERCGDQRTMSSAILNLANCYLSLGDFERAERELDRATALAERLSLPYIAAVCKNCRGLLLAQAGRDLALARELELEALEFFKVRERRFEGGTLVRLGIIDTLAGDYDAADRHASDALSVLPTASSIRLHALAVQARARLLAGRLAEAREAAAVAYAAYMDLAYVPEEGEVLIGLTYAEVLLASGEPERAGPVLAHAHARLLDRAATLEPALRESYLRRVPENARVQALAAEQGVTTGA